MRNKPRFKYFTLLLFITGTTSAASAPEIKKTKLMPQRKKQTTTLQASIVRRLCCDTCLLGLVKNIIKYIRVETEQTKMEWRAETLKAF